jgi:membrane protein CcdC involved in cytochrome C biogenesis
VIYFILWFIIGYGTVGYKLYQEYEEGKGITLNRLSGMFFIGLLGMLVPLMWAINLLFDFYNKRGDTIIFGKEEK